MWRRGVPVRSPVMGLTMPEASLLASDVSVNSPSDPAAPSSSLIEVCVLQPAVQTVEPPTGISALGEMAGRMVRKMASATWHLTKPFRSSWHEREKAEQVGGPWVSWQPLPQTHIPLQHTDKFIPAKHLGVTVAEMLPWAICQRDHISRPTLCPVFG